MTTLLGSLQSLRSTDTQYFSLNNQSLHRLNIFQSWLELAQKNGYDLESEIVGKQILDIGCGQGDMVELCAAVLKTQGSSKSRVIGVDPASPDYGTPWTLGQAQTRISVGPLAEYVSFEQSTAPALVGSQCEGKYSVAYFAHSLYYFPSSAVLVETFKSLLEAGVKTLLVAEWALSTSRLTALPHLLAVLLQSMHPLPDGNIRMVLSPDAYIAVAIQTGWELVEGETITPGAKLEDGKWEAGIAKSIVKDVGLETQASQSLGDRNLESGHLESLKAHADALAASIAGLPGTTVDEIESMDVWTAVFKPIHRT